MFQNAMIINYFLASAFTVLTLEEQLIKHVSYDFMWSVSKFGFLTAFKWAYMPTATKPFVKALSTEASFTYLTLFWFPYYSQAYSALNFLLY
jgi:hypothetical protein